MTNHRGLCSVPAMRFPGYSTLLLTASLVVAPACTKKDETSGETAAKKESGGGDEVKTEDKKTDDGGAAKSTGGGEKLGEQPAGAGGGIVSAGSGAAKLAVGGFPSSVTLIPDQAEFILGISVGSIMSSPIYALASAELAQDPDIQGVINILKNCNVDAAKLESIVVGAAKDENFVAVMIGEGVGEDANASCIIKGVQKQAGDPEIADVVTQDGKKMIQFTDGRAYLVDGRTLALATTAWEGALGELIDGKGTPAVSNSKKDLFAKVNGAASIWGVAVVPPELASMGAMFGAPAEISTVQTVTGSVDLSSGAAINMLAGFASEDAAKSVATWMQTMLGEATKDAPAEVAGVVKSVKIEAAGKDVTVAMTATMDDINKAAAAPI
jgi:hypothetical protein